MAFVENLNHGSVRNLGQDNVPQHLELVRAVFPGTYKLIDSGDSRRHSRSREGYRMTVTLCAWVREVREGNWSESIAHGGKSWGDVHEAISVGRLRAPAAELSQAL